MRPAVPYPGTFSQPCRVLIPAVHGRELAIDEARHELQQHSNAYLPCHWLIEEETQRPVWPLSQVQDLRSLLICTKSAAWLHACGIVCEQPRLTATAGAGASAAKAKRARTHQTLSPMIKTQHSCVRWRKETGRTAAPHQSSPRRRTVLYSMSAFRQPSSRSTANPRQ